LFARDGRKIIGGMGIARHKQMEAGTKKKEEAQIYIGYHKISR
jgi:D-aminopeptidase